MAMAAMARTGLVSRTLLLHPPCCILLFPRPSRLTISAFAFSSPVSSAAATTLHDDDSLPTILDKLRSRHIPAPLPPPSKTAPPSPQSCPKPDALPSSFSHLALSDELMAAVLELRLTQPTEVQCLAVPAILDGHSVVVASHTGSGKTLAYMLPLVQRLRQEEMQLGQATRARRPRAVVLCPTRELAEQVFRVAKSICHNARFRAAMIGGGVRMKPQEDALNSPVDMLVGTPGRVLQHIEERHMAYGDIKYVVLDEADTMFDRGFGPDVRKFLRPLRNRSCKPGDVGFQTILVTATITKAVQRLLDEEFPGIRHIQTSTLHKKVSTARHGFIKLSGTENKLESLLQVLEPSLAKGDRVMVFCNTLNSCRAVDHFLTENNISTANYHGAVPADERVEALNKFKNEDGNRPALVCTDLAARGLDLVVDHVIMFDFPLNSIDYLHRTGRTARMGAKGKITSLVTKRSLALAEQIEEAIERGETLEGISSHKETIEASKTQTAKLKPKEKGRTDKPTSQVRTRRKSMISSPRKSPVVHLAKGPVNSQSRAKGPRPVVSSLKTSPERQAKGSDNAKSGAHRSKTVVSSLKRSSDVRLSKGPVTLKSGAKKVAVKASKRVLKIPAKRLQQDPLGKQAVTCLCRCACILA